MSTGGHTSCFLPLPYLLLGNRACLQAPPVKSPFFLKDNRKGPQLGLRVWFSWESLSCCLPLVHGPWTSAMLLSFVHGIDNLSKKCLTPANPSLCLSLAPHSKQSKCLFLFVLLHNVAVVKTNQFSQEICQKSNWNYQACFSETCH